jgi:thioredoxin reductase
MSQAMKWGAEVTFDDVTAIEKKGEKQFVETGANGDTYQGKAIILAYGKTPRSLGVPGEKEYSGKGVSYCVTCDAPLFKDKTVAVVGGGNSALEGALILSQICAKVYLVHRRDQFRGEEVLVKQILDAPNIEPVLSAVSQEVLGDGRSVTALRVQSVTDPSQTRDLTVNGIFVEIGFIVNSALIENLVTLDPLKQVIINHKQETSTSGIFAAGDLTETPYKQAVISASEGAKAALSAYSYIYDGKNAGVDWSGK